MKIPKLFFFMNSVCAIENNYEISIRIVHVVSKAYHKPLYNIGAVEFGNILMRILKFNLLNSNATKSVLFAWKLLLF